MEETDTTVESPAAGADIHVHLVSDTRFDRFDQ